MGKFDKKLKNEQPIKNKVKVKKELFDKKNENARNKKIMENILGK